MYTGMKRKINIIMYMNVQWKNVYLCIAEKNVQLKNVYACVQCTKIVHVCTAEKMCAFMYRDRMYISSGKCTYMQ